MDFVEDDRIPIEEIIEKITPKDLVKAENEKKTVTLTSVPYTYKSPDLQSRVRQSVRSESRKDGVHQVGIFKKKLTF